MKTEEFDKPAPEEQQFYSSDGCRVGTLNELLQCLEHLNQDLFSQHFNNEKNDFAAWMQYSLGMPEAANKAQRAGSREEMIMLLKELKEDVREMKDAANVDNQQSGPGAAQEEDEQENSSQVIEDINSEYEALMERLSEKRKKGKYTKIAEIKLLGIPYKVNLFRVTNDKKIITYIKKLMREAEQELQYEYDDEKEQQVTL